LRALTVGRRRRLGAGLALVVALAVVVGVVLSAGSPSAPTDQAGSGQSTGSTTVQRRDLVQTDTESGTLSYRDPQTVYDRLSGTVTWLPSVGAVIKPGGTLFRVDGRPVILMNGSTPAYRALSASDDYGADVLQLNRNLVRLGFNSDGIVVNDIWQPATTVGVEAFQESLGETATGILSLGQVVFLPGNQLVSTVDGTLGSTGGGSSAGSGGSANSASIPSTRPAPQFVSLQSACPTTTLATATSTAPCSGAPPHRRIPRSHSRPPSRAQSKQTLAALIALLKAELAELRAEHGSSAAGNGSSGSGRSGSSGNGAGGSGSSGGGSSGSGNSGGSGSGNSGGGNSGGGNSGGGNSGSGNSGSGNSGSGGSGGGGATPQAILQTASTHLVVTVDLPATSQSEAAVGEHVTVEMPAGNTVPGRITEVSPVAQSSSSSDNGSGSGSSGGGSSGNSGSGSNGSSGSSGSSTVPVTIALRGRHSGAGLDQAAVSVNFAQQRANHVLSVPVTALLAVSGGSYAVQAAAAPHRLIPVTPGLFAAGYVQIAGSGIHPGLQVTDSQG
jgi:hypothetical protein